MTRRSFMEIANATGVLLMMRPVFACCCALFVMGRGAPAWAAESSTRITIISPVELAASLGNVSILDARSEELFLAGHVPGSQRMAWEDWTDERPGAFNYVFGDARRWGKVPSDVKHLEERLRVLGLGNRRRIVIVGQPRGYGEEGRAAWNVVYWGADDVALLDGGFAAWATDVRHPIAKGAPAAVAPGDFTVRVRPERRANADDVARAVHDSRPLLDARTVEEFKGKRVTGQKRGGHVPGAQLVRVDALYKDDGTFLDGSALTSLVRLGERPPVTYCTGGVRSALLAVLLEARLGVVAANYDGSLWEWSADTSRPMSTAAP